MRFALRSEHSLAELPHQRGRTWKKAKFVSKKTLAHTTDFGPKLWFHQPSGCGGCTNFHAAKEHRHWNISSTSSTVKTFSFNYIVINTNVRQSGSFHTWRANCYQKFWGLLLCCCPHTSQNRSLIMMTKFKSENKKTNTSRELQKCTLWSCPHLKYSVKYSLFPQS